MKALLGLLVLLIVSAVAVVASLKFLEKRKAQLAWEASTAKAVHELWGRIQESGKTPDAGSICQLYEHYVLVRHLGLVVQYRKLSPPTGHTLREIQDLQKAAAGKYAKALVELPKTKLYRVDCVRIDLRPALSWPGEMQYLQIRSEENWRYEMWQLTDWEPELSGILEHISGR